MVTDGTAHLPGSAGDLVHRVRGAARAGVHLIQIREARLEAGALARLVRACLDAVAGTRARVVVNDRLDVALATGAHGVHLRAVSPAGPVVRSCCPPGFLVSRSVHSGDEAAAVAREGGLDYLLAGTVFPTPSKPGASGVGLEGLTAAVNVTSLPVLAVGGVDGSRAAGVARSGAAGFAAIRFWTVPEPELRGAVRDVVAAFTQSRRPTDNPVA